MSRETRTCEGCGDEHEPVVVNTNDGVATVKCPACSAEDKVPQSTIDMSTDYPAGGGAEYPDRRP